MGLRRSFHAVRDLAHAHAPIRAIAVTLAVAAVATGVSGFCNATASAAARSTASKPAIVVDVHKYGARGDGQHNDSHALQLAINAVAARPGSTVYLPRGTYHCPTPIRLAGHVNLRGDGSSISWLAGHLDFGSHSTISKLKIGASKMSAVSNLAGASHTAFRHCRFRGGGGSGSGCAVLTLGSSSGSSHSLSHVAFIGCQVERNLGTEDWSVDGGYGHGFSDISILENSAAGGSQVSDLKFISCHVGVPNGSGGHDTGSPSAGLVVWSSRGRVAQGWHRITIRGCTFEATDRFCIDLADFPAANGRHLSGPALIEGNVIKGGGYGPGEHPWSYSICLEAPRNVTIRHNRIYAAYGSTICGSYGPGSHTVIAYNHIDLTVSNGVHQTGDEAVVLKGQDSVFRGNVIRAGAGSGPLLYLKQTSRDRVTGNRFYDTRSSGNPAMVLLRDASHNLLTGNVFSTAAPSNPRISIEGTSTANTFRHNTFRHS